MRLSNLLILSSLVSGLILASCGTEANSPQHNPSDISAISSDQFHDYWYQGKAEIASYGLEQARYGEMRQGHAVLVFVTEDFSASKLVKLDNPAQAGEDRVPILKLNFTKKFNTGIYPYSMMQSVFTPVDDQKRSLKATVSSQEWCGHTFGQFMLDQAGYTWTGHSYFESEGEQQFTVGDYLLEDELWNRIRIAPDQLPTGEISLIPGGFYLRLGHQSVKAQPAKLTLTEDDGVMVYHIDYSGLSRELIIRFEKKFPHQILGWEETYPSGFGPNAKPMTTKGTLMKTLMSDYWRRNSNADAPLRNTLNLP